jgi:hypothetical protein
LPELVIHQDFRVITVANLLPVVPAAVRYYKTIEVAHQVAIYAAKLNYIGLVRVVKKLNSAQ